MNNLKLISWLLVISLLLITKASIATHYYLSERGNDHNNGKTKNTAWKTLNKLGKEMKSFQPGDSIWLERNSRFKGSIVVSCSNIFIGAFGEGTNPIITGALNINHWKIHRGNIWMAPCDIEPTNLFINDKSQPLGRFPNQGYMTISGSTTSSTSLQDSSMQFENGYWKGAEVVTRSSRWTLDRLSISNYDNKTFTFKNPASYPLQNGFGYFIQDHLATLDEYGEWYFDPHTKLIYLFLPSDQQPGDYRTKVSEDNIGLNIENVQNATISDITFSQYRVAGIKVKNSSLIVLKNLNINHSGKNGLEVIGCTSIKVNSCSISNIHNNGVLWHNTNKGEFTQNSICYTGLEPGRGESGNGAYIGLSITEDEGLAGTNLFQYNTIDSTGYSAIDFRTGNTQIKDNLISHFCLVKDDGGGVYTWHNTKRGNVIKNNIIYNGMGEGTGTTKPFQRFAHGIYIDDQSKNISIAMNRVFGCATSGIFLHNAKSIVLNGNIVYGNGYSIANTERGQLYIRLDTLGLFGSNRALDLTITNNQWIVENLTSNCIFLFAEKDTDLNQLGNFQGNKFRAITQHQTLIKSVQNSTYCPFATYNLQEWQRLKLYEKGSDFKYITVKKEAPVNNNLIKNGTLTKDNEGWMIWPSTSLLQQELIGILDGPSLKVVVPVNMNEALVYHGGFSLSKGKQYKLSFSAMAAYNSTLEFAPLMANAPWEALSAYTCFPLGDTSRTYTYFFIAETDAHQARINFKSHASFWIDSISLQEVQME